MKCVTDIVYDPANELALDLYLPDTLTASACVIYMHGGGFQKGSRQEVEAGYFAQPLTDAGFAVASISYRLNTKITAFSDKNKAYILAYTARSAKVGLAMSPKLYGPAFMGAMEDLSKAVGYLWVEGQGLGIASNRVGVIGVSAGGIAALALAYPPTHWMAHVAKPDAVVAISSAFVQPWRLQADGPPCLLYHGLNDRVISIEDNDVGMLRAEQTGAPVTLVNTGVKGHATQVDTVLDGTDRNGVPYMQSVIDHFARLVDD